ncbi:hypothetical protein [Prevotella disiens]|uniref:hypothetical protein n=1 Tax=Prevotella disiens TaxID=28130 RepID=UPI00336ACD4B
MPISPQVGAALIGGGASLIGGLINGSSQNSANRTNMAIARETNRANMSMLKYQNAFNQEMWNKNNEYNTPLAQRQRYEQAGINPYLAMSNIQSGNASSALQSANGNAMQGARVEPVTGYGDAISNGVNQAVATYTQLQQARKVKAEADGQEIGNMSLAARYKAMLDNMKGEYKFKVSQTNLNDLDFKFRNKTFQQDVDMKNLGVETAKELRTKMQLQNAYQRILNSTAQLNLDFLNKYGEERIKNEISNQLADLATKAQSIVESKARVSQGWAHIGIEKYNAKTNRMNAQTNRMNAETQRTLVNKQVDVMAKQIDLIAEQTTGHKLSNKEKQQLMPILVEQANQTVEGMKNNNFTPSLIRSFKENGSIGWNLLDAAGYGLGQVGNLFGGLIK